MLILWPGLTGNIIMRTVQLTPASRLTCVAAVSRQIDHEEAVVPSRQGVRRPPEVWVLICRSLPTEPALQISSAVCQSVERCVRNEFVMIFRVKYICVSVVTMYLIVGFADNLIKLGFLHLIRSY